MSANRVVLATEPAFRLGGLEIRPSTREAVGAAFHDVMEPRVAQVLVVLAQARGNVVSRDELVARCWEGRIVSDDVVNRILSRIRHLSQRDGGASFSLETIKKVGYRLKGEIGPVGAAPAPSGTATRPTHSGPPVLAVLPFDNLSADSDLDYFSDGVSEEIRHTIARTAGLRVIGRSSSFQFRGADKATRRVADELGATHILDGSIRRSGSRIRIAAQLIEAASQTALWSERFERDLSDVFALQDELAGAIATALRLSFAGSANAPVDPLAYDLYLRARASPEQWLGGPRHALLEQAIARAPDFAAAWAALSMTLAVGVQLEHDPEKATASAMKAAAAAERALMLDPGAGTAYAAQALLLPICGKFAEGEALLRRALDTSPEDPLIRMHASRFFGGIGYGREWFEHAERAYEIDPLFAVTSHWYAIALHGCGRQVEADALFDRNLKLWPLVGYTAAVPMMLALVVGDEARAAWFASYMHSAAMAVDPRGQQMLGLYELVRNWTPATAAAELARRREQLEQTGTIDLEFEWFCRHGGSDAIYDLVDRSSFAPLFQSAGRFVNDRFFLHQLFNPTNAVAQRRTPRFVKLCHRLGLVALWAESGRWPDCVDEVAPYYDFKAEARRLLAAG